jgi:hypothetical protein
MDTGKLKAKAQNLKDALEVVDCLVRSVLIPKEVLILANRAHLLLWEIEDCLGEQLRHDESAAWAEHAERCRAGVGK